MEEANDNEIIWGEITPQAIPQLRHLMKKIYVPFLNQLNDEEWGNEKEAKDGFLAQSGTFTKEVSEAKKLISPG